MMNDQELDEVMVSSQSNDEESQSFKTLMIRKQMSLLRLKKRKVHQTLTGKTYMPNEKILYRMHTN